MAEHQPDVHERILSTFEQVGPDPNTHGATDPAIDSFGAAQWVEAVPVAVREVLRLIGAEPGSWFDDSDFGTDLVDARHKQAVVWALEDVEHEMRDLDGMLVLACREGYQFHVIDGADLRGEDPPVWRVLEGTYAVREWPSVTAWFADCAPAG